MKPKGYFREGGKTKPITQKKGITEDKLNVSVKGNNDTIEVGTKKPTGGMKGNREKKLLTVESYLDAAHIGQPIDGIPLNSIIEYEEGKTNDYKIVGYKQGSTFSEKTIKHIAPNMRTYQLSVYGEPESDYGKIYAINEEVAEKVARQELRGDVEFELYDMTPSGSRQRVFHYR